jgi:dienelactone hydrolase
VPALRFVPSGRGPFAGLIVQHGLPSSKEDVAFDAEDLAGLGAVVIAIDAPFRSAEWSADRVHAT